jgi:hypothetical protein
LLISLRSIYPLRVFVLRCPWVRFALFYGTKQDHLLDRITCDPEKFGGKPIIRGRRLAVEHVLDMLASGDDSTTILAGYP